MIEHPAEDIVGAEAFGIGLVADDDPVPEHVAREALDVVRGHVVAAREEGVPLGRADERDRGAGTGSELEERGQLERVPRAMPRVVRR